MKKGGSPRHTWLESMLYAGCPEELCWDLLGMRGQLLPASEDEAEEEMLPPALPAKRRARDPKGDRTSEHSTGAATPSESARSTPRGPRGERGQRSRSPGRRHAGTEQSGTARRRRGHSKIPRTYHSDEPREEHGRRGGEDPPREDPRDAPRTARASQEPPVGPTFVPTIHIVVFGQDHHYVRWDAGNPVPDLPDLESHVLHLDPRANLDVTTIGDPATSHLSQHDGRHRDIRAGCWLGLMAKCERTFVEWLDYLAIAVGRTTEMAPRVIASLCCRAGRRRSPAGADFIQRVLERTLRCEVQVHLIDFRPCNLECDECREHPEVTRVEASMIFVAGIKCRQLWLDHGEPSSRYVGAPFDVHR